MLLLFRVADCLDFHGQMWQFLKYRVFAAKGSIMDISMGYLKDADGSAKFSHGKTSVLACVRGPDQISQQKEIVDKATIVVHYESKSGQSNCSDRKMEHFIAQVCDRMIITTMHPRTSIHINITELHNDGCLSACAVNAAMLALLDAGISMRHTVAAATCCLDNTESIHVNPSKDTLEESCGVMTLVVESETKQLLSLTTTGTFSTQQLTQSVTSLSNECIKMFESFRLLLSGFNSTR